MMRTTLAMALAVLCAWGLAFAQVRTIDSSQTGVAGAGSRTVSGTTSKPAKPPIVKPGKTPTSKPVKPAKYATPTDREIYSSKTMMAGLYERAKKEVNPNLHKVETKHFIIFSGLSPNLDKGIGDTMERMYTVLCKQFDIEPNESVWVGKCGIFLLTQNPKEQFANFAMKVDGLDERIAKGAAGYFRSTAIQSYIVMKPPPSGRDWELDYWQSTMVHEATHAFLFRYVSNKTVPTWLNEGIAETSAQTIMNSKYLLKRMREANKAAVKGEDYSSVFSAVSLKEFDYGIAQSWVRFLLSKDQKAFIKFVALCKEGVKDEEAMQETYKLSREEFLQGWAKWVNAQK